MSTSNFRPALPVLQHPITNIDTNVISPDLTYNDNLIYHYTGGIALAALKRWKEAEEYFEICATSPGLVPAGLQMEALKKLRLVQLISTGKVSYFTNLSNPMHLMVHDILGLEFAKIHSHSTCTTLQIHTVLGIHQCLSSQHSAAS